MAIKITGMNSGLDTDSIIQELVSANSSKKNSLEKAQTKLSWKQAAWSSLNAKIKSFYSSILSNFRFQGSFIKKKTTVSNTNIATVTSGDSAVDGSQSMVVKQLAKAGYLTGGRLSSDKSVTSGTNLNTLTSGKSGYTAIGADEAASFDVTVGGKTTSIDLTGSSSINDVIDKLNSAGVNASYDSTNQRIFVSVSDSGAENDFKLTANNVNGLKALSGLGLLTKEELAGNSSADSELAAAYDAISGTIDETAAASYITGKATGFAAGLQNGNPTAATVQGYFDTITKLNAAWDSSDSKTLYDEAVAAGVDRDAISAGIKTIAEKREYLQLTEKKNSLAEGEELTEAETQKLTDYQTAYGDASAISTDDLNAEEQKLSNYATALDSYDSYQSDLASLNGQIKSAAKNAKILNDYYAQQYKSQLDAVSGVSYADKKASIEAQITEATAAGQDTSDLETMYSVLSTMADNEEIYTNASLPAGAADYDASEGIRNRAIAAVTSEAAAAYEVVNNSNAYLDGATGSAVRVQGQDAIIELNGAEFNSSSNSFAINGLTITAKALSAVTGTDAAGNNIYEEVQLNTEDDIDGIYDMVKNFFTEYNSLIKEIDTLYNAESAKDYDPLSSEEKDSMTDDEVTKWEDKIKSSLLRHDSDLSTVRNTLKTALLEAIEVDGKTYSLSSFGINTEDYFNAADNEKGMYHIDGDSTDSVSKSNPDKLKSLMATDPDVVSGFFSKLAGNLYSTMQKMSQTSDNRTYGNFYNDKVLKSQYDEYTTKISKQEKKLSALEDKYYSMFSSMETQLSKINSTSSYISSMFG